MRLLIINRCSLRRANSPPERKLRIAYRDRKKADDRTAKRYEDNRLAERIEKKVQKAMQRIEDPHNRLATGKLSSTIKYKSVQKSSSMDSGELSTLDSHRRHDDIKAKSKGKNNSNIVGTGSQTAQLSVTNILAVTEALSQTCSPLKQKRGCNAKGKAPTIGYTRLSGTTRVRVKCETRPNKHAEDDARGKQRKVAATGASGKKVQLGAKGECEGERRSLGGIVRPKASRNCGMSYGDLVAKVTKEIAQIQQQQQQNTSQKGTERRAGRLCKH